MPILYWNVLLGRRSGFGRTAPDFAFGVGMGGRGTFDFLAGHVRRAPRWIRHAGFEWAFLLAMEPRRLWKRYLIRDMKFLVLALREMRKLGGKNETRE